MMTGLSPKNHGRVGYRDGVEWNYDTTLAGEFTRQGYRTHAIGKMHVYPERNQLGFQSVELHDGYLHFARNRCSQKEIDDDYLSWLRQQTGRPDADYFEHGVNCNSVVARPWPLDEYLHPTNWVVSRGIEFLSKQGNDDPFFLYLSLHRPHPPYDPPAWAFEQYLYQEMPPPPIGNWVSYFGDLDQSHSPEAFVARYRPEILQRARAGYYGHMTHIDHQINRFLEILKEYGLSENSWIIFTSDHGEMMGDHHLFRKGYPYEGSARLPLIVRAPENLQSPRNLTCNTVVELRDILPTLLDFAGLPIPGGIDGKSFMPQTLGEKSENLRPWLHGEHVLFNYSIQWLTDGEEKYIWHSRDGREQLFHLPSDPNEEKDLSLLGDSETASRLKLWKKRLIAELKERKEGFVDSDQNLVSGLKVNSLLN